MNSENESLERDELIFVPTLIDSFDVTSHSYRNTHLEDKPSFAPLTDSYFYTDCIK